MNDQWGPQCGEDECLREFAGFPAGILERDRTG